MLERKYKFPLDHEHAKSVKLKENIKLLRKELEGEVSKDTMTKIRNKAKLIGISESELLRYLKQEVKKNDILAAEYCKQPGKQNLNERIMSDFIKNLPIISNVVNYSTDGQDALFICGGRISSHRGTSDNTKSIDISWEYTFEGQSLKFYSTLKYTKSSGGSQLLQISDVKNFLKAACDVRTPDERFIAVTDGKIYTSPYREKASGRKYIHRMDCLEEESRKSTVKITNTDELLWRIVDMIVEWLAEKVLLGEFEADSVEKEKARLYAIRDNLYEG